MSRSYEYSYALEAARRQAMYNARVSATTEGFYRRYIEQFNKMSKKGYAAYIPSEMQRLQSDLERIRDLIVSNPTEARDLSFEVGSYIRSMSSLADAAVEQFDRAERMRVEKLREERTRQQDENIGLYFDLIHEIRNPIVVNFSLDKLQELRRQIESGQITKQKDIRQAVSRIITEAEQHTEAWKKKTIEADKKKNVADKLAEAESRIHEEKLEDKEKTYEFIERIHRLKQDLETGKSDCAAVESSILQLETEVDDTLVTEEVRRETVKAIIKQLRSQEFTVEKPQMVVTDNKDYVKIVARKPSGKRAVCNVDLHGKIAYKFDNYEGMTCIKDIEKFNVDLEQVYSVKLSDERVLWSNPDRLSMDATEMPKSEGRKV